MLYGEKITNVEVLGTQWIGTVTNSGQNTEKEPFGLTFLSSNHIPCSKSAAKIAFFHILWRPSARGVLTDSGGMNIPNDYSRV